MTNHHLNRVARDLAVEQSLDAAIEINEVINHKRQDAPALLKLASLLVGTQSEGTAPSKRELLNNSQFASLSYRAAVSTKGPATSQDLDLILDLLLRAIGPGLADFSPDDLICIRDFCLGLNRELTSAVANRTPEPVLARSSKAGSMALYDN
ncbi:MAG: hypothetical protein ACREDD_04385 [Methylocella sp.]